MSRILVFGSVAESLVSFREALLRELMVNGHDVITMASNAPVQTLKHLKDAGIDYHRVSFEKSTVNVVGELHTLMQLIDVFKKIAPDILLSYTIKPVIYGSIAAKVAGVSRIYSIISGLGYAFSHSGIRSNLIGTASRWLYKVALKYNDKVFFQNPDNLRFFIDSGIVACPGKAVLVNGSGIDLQFFKPADYPTDIVFLLIARLIRDKGIYQYVEAAKTIRRKYPRVRFKLGGFIDSNPHAILKQDLDSWKASGIVEYLGYLHDVRPAIRAASIYVLPSYYPEGTPHSVLEAMAMQRAIITTDTPGCRETVQHGKNGFLVPAKDTHSLVRAMEYFIMQPEQISIMGRVSRQIAEQKFDVKKINTMIMQHMDLQQ